MTEPSTPEDLVRAAGDVGVRAQEVLAAIRATPRADFVPAGHVGGAYVDTPLPIGHGQVTTQPSLSAQMIEALQLAGTERVLEIGTGYGFQTALLVRLAAEVVSIERLPDISEQARRNLAAQHVDNVRLLVGDGSLGVPEASPFDGILVAAAYPEVPGPLAQQLRTGGRLVQPIGSGGHEQIVVYRQSSGGLERQKGLTPASFVRLYGQHAYSDTAE